jgi:hypothetical protein
MDEYDSYGAAAGYQSAIDYNTELEIQEKIRRYEDKMMRATLNRITRIEECKEKLQYANQAVREKVQLTEGSDSLKEYETLQRYCDRQVKSRKIIKRKGEELEEHVTWKRHKDGEKDNLRRMRLKEQYAQEMKKLQAAVAEYQERWQQLGYSNPHDYEMMMTDQEVGRRVKRHLRVQDQTDNMKRILNQ